MTPSDESLPSSLREAIATTVGRMRTARREAIEAYPAGSPQWEYDGRTWYWPGGEELPYFFDLCEGEAAALAALEERFDLSRIGVGTGRVVLTGALADDEAENGMVEGDGIEISAADDDRAIKLARYGPSAEMGDGRRQNRRELDLSRTIGEHPFLPVLWGDPGGDWVVMPRAHVPDADGLESERVLESVRAELEPYADYVHFDELKPENVGRWNGREWLLDYGRPPDDQLPESGADRF
jgi:hypothetical protein